MQLSQTDNDLRVILGMIFDFWFLFAEMVERDLAAIITADEFPIALTHGPFLVPLKVQNGMR